MSSVLYLSCILHLFVLLFCITNMLYWVSHIYALLDKPDIYNYNLSYLLSLMFVTEKVNYCSKSIVDVKCHDGKHII